VGEGAAQNRVRPALLAAHLQGEEAGDDLMNLKFGLKMFFWQIFIFY
jgi:hypothetical protein